MRRVRFVHIVVEQPGVEMDLERFAYVRWFSGKLQHEELRDVEMPEEDIFFWVFD